MKRNLNDTWAQYQLLMDKDGILLAAEEILHRLERRRTIESPTEVISYLAARCAHLPHEVFGRMWLDTRHRVIFVHRHRRQLRGSSTHLRQACPGAQRRRHGSIPQPPLRQPRAQRCSPRHHCQAQAAAGPAERAGFGPRRPGWDPRRESGGQGGASRYNKARKTGLVLLALRAMNSHVWSPLCSSCYTGNGADSEVVYNRQYGAHCLA